MALAGPIYLFLRAAVPRPAAQGCQAVFLSRHIGWSHLFPFSFLLVHVSALRSGLRKQFSLLELQEVKPGTLALIP